MYPKTFADSFVNTNGRMTCLSSCRSPRRRSRGASHLSPSDTRFWPIRVKQARIKDSILTHILAAIGRAGLVLVDISNQRAADLCVGRIQTSCTSWGWRTP